MKLEIKHLAPYLPYGLKIEPYQKVLSCGYLTKDELDISTFEDKNIEDIKPILRPLSDLTKEIEHNGERFVPNEYFYKNWFIKIREDGHFSRDNGDGTCEGFSYKSAPYDLIEHLFEFHFDVFGLIDSGLAIDLNTIQK